MKVCLHVFDPRALPFEQYLIISRRIDLTLIKLESINAVEFGGGSEPIMKGDFCD